jgi:hypothetical protein
MVARRALRYRPLSVILMPGSLATHRAGAAGTTPREADVIV